MKKFFIVSGISFGVLYLLYLVVTDRVDHTPYFNTGYYKTSCRRIDQLAKSTVTTCDSIQAGFARVSITPELDSQEDDPVSGKFVQLPLAGFGARKGKMATGVHDSVFVKAIALKIGHQTLIFAGADLLIMPPEITDSVVFLLSAKGIGRDQLFFSATHTHSGIGSWGHGFISEQFAGKENKNLKSWLVRQITAAVTAAIADLRPARIGSGAFDAGAYTRNRLVGESGTKNDDFSFIWIEQNGRRKGVIGSFSAHSTTLGSGNMEISADYPGYWARKMEAGSANLALFAAGSMGSQSPVGKGKEFEKAKMIGEALADSLNAILPKVVLHDKITCSSVCLKMQLPGYNFRLTPKINLSSGLSRKLMAFPESVFLQAARLGNMVWITTPADFSGEYALPIRDALAAKGFLSNVTGFNGSYVGYIIPDRYFYLDEYEPKTMGWFGPYMGEYSMELIRRITAIVIEGKPSE